MNDPRYSVAPPLPPVSEWRLVDHALACAKSRGVYDVNRVELHDWNPDGEDVGRLGSQAPGLFVYTPEGKLSLHIMTEHDRPLIDRETSDAERGEIFGPYIGYFGTYSVDYEAMTVTHNIEGAKLPNRIGRAATRSFRFEDGDLVLDFSNPDGWRFYRRLERVESFKSLDGGRAGGGRTSASEPSTS